MGDEIRSFEDLDCWKACRDLRRFVMTEVIPNLPKHERYAMGDNLIRAARSMTRNIAEGYGRYHHRDNAKFCSNTRGSCQEVLDDLITCHDDGYISDEELAEGRKLATSAIMLTNGYIRYLRRAAKAQPPDTAKEDGPEWAFGSEADESLPDPFANNE